MRAGTETELLPRFKSYENPATIDRIDENENYLHTDFGTDLVKLGSPLAPLQLKEGVDGNFRTLHTVLFDLDVRAGIGARRYYQRSELAIDQSTGVDCVKAVSGYHLEGVEGTVVGMVRISRVALTTEFDGLVSSQDLNTAVFTWRSQLSLHIVSIAALNYRLNITREPNRQVGKANIMEQLLQLRFFYSLL